MEEEEKRSSEEFVWCFRCQPPPPTPEKCIVRHFLVIVGGETLLLPLSSFYERRAGRMCKENEQRKERVVKPKRFGKEEAGLGTF